MTSASLIGLDLDTATRFKSFRNWLHDMAGEELIDLIWQHTYVNGKLHIVIMLFYIH